MTIRLSNYMFLQEFQLVMGEICETVNEFYS